MGKIIDKKNILIDNYMYEKLRKLYKKYEGGYINVYIQ